MSCENKLVTSTFNDTILELNSTFVSEGTLPSGSTWQINPVPMTRGGTIARKCASRTQRGKAPWRFLTSHMTHCCEGDECESGDDEPVGMHS